MSTTTTPLWHQSARARTHRRRRATLGLYINTLLESTHAYCALRRGLRHDRRLRRPVSACGARAIRRATRGLREWRESCLETTRSARHFEPPPPFLRRGAAASARHRRRHCARTPRGRRESMRCASSASCSSLAAAQRRPPWQRGAGHVGLLFALPAGRRSAQPRCARCTRRMLRRAHVAARRASAPPFCASRRRRTFPRNPSPPPQEARAATMPRSLRAAFAADCAGPADCAAQPPWSSSRLARAVRGTKGRAAAC